MLLYTSSWMDTGPVEHYSQAPLFVTVLVFLAIAGAQLSQRSWRAAVATLILLTLTFRSVPLEMTGWAALVFFLGWTIWRSGHLGNRRALWVGLAWLGVGTGWWLGFPSTTIWSPSVCRSNLKNLATAVEMYRQDHKRLPSGVTQLAPLYLKGLPRCFGERRTPYVIETEGEAYTLTCRGAQHTRHPVDPYYAGPESSPTP